MESAVFTSIRQSKKIDQNEYLSQWQNFYENYESSNISFLLCEKKEDNKNPLEENERVSRNVEKSSFKKVKRSKTVDVGAFMNSLKEILEEKHHFVKDYHIDDNKAKTIKSHYEEMSKGENSTDFSTLETAITPLRDLKIEDASTLTPFRISESPKPIINKMEELRNTLKRNDYGYNNKETRKYSVKKGVNKNTRSSRVLKFD